MDKIDRNFPAQGSEGALHQYQRTMDPIGAPDPLDIGCGKLMPVRWTQLCVVYKYDHTGFCTRNLVEDKPFEMNVLVQTTRGRWDFLGRTGVEPVDTTTLVAGIQGEHYGCRHDHRYMDSNVIASLRANALDDDDEPLFDRQTLPAGVAPSMLRAVAAESDDAFDSRVFEIFDCVSIESLRNTRPRQASRLRMQRVKRFIESHAFEDLALAEIASCVNLSPFACLRQFKASTGMTPHAYQNILRVRHAQALLRNAAFPISRVAASVGIRDQCYFSRWFSKETGVSPSEFRKQS